jgi:DMSO/TMAO reductase YedYZ molybdopterin-dependent catalytic subunit
MGSRHALSRRALLRRMGVTGAAGLLVPRLDSLPPQTSITIADFDLGLLDDWLTPVDLFFVREHFPAPAVSSSAWKVSIAGAAAAPYEINYEQLVELPRKELTVTLECAENPVGGGFVGNAAWSGVSLAALLERARPTDQARFVRLWGGDHNPNKSLYYTRTIPLAQAMNADALLAYRMNSSPLPPDHGYPLRAVIPGRYAMESVKWLRKVEVLTRPDDSPFMTQSYRRRVGEQTAPLEEIKVKAVFSRPMDGAVLYGRDFIVRGAAWAGAGPVGKVEVSTDGAKTWQSARIETQHGSAPYAWVFWQYRWRIPGPGKYALAVRAADGQGRVQPVRRDPKRSDSYENNSIQTVRCTVV